VLAVLLRDMKVLLAKDGTTMMVATHDGRLCGCRPS
jgi:hypothetical protein